MIERGYEQVIRAHQAQRERRAAGGEGTECHDRLGFIERARQACEIWFAGAGLAVRIRFEAASSSPRQTLTAALEAVEERLTA